MKGLPLPSAGELRALLVYDTLPPGCIAKAVIRSDLAPHLRPGEFAIVDTADRQPVAGELFLVAWMGNPGRDGREQTQLCEAFRRSHECDGELFTAWWVGSMRNRFSPETRARLVRENQWGTLGWSNGPYRDGALERQIRGRVIGRLASGYEEPRRLTAGRAP